MKFSTVVYALASLSLASAAAIPSKDMTTLAERGASASGGQLTWYSGSSLQNPACGGSAPTDNSMAVAVPYGSPAKCNQWIKISYQGKSVTAKVRDRCEGCNWNSVDATKQVFRSLAPLSKGRLSNIKYTVL